MAGGRWDAAFRRCTELLAPVIEKYGIGAVTCYRQPAGALVLPWPLHRCAAWHVGHPAQLLPGHRRPVAEESVVAPDVRRLVELPGSRHRAHRPADRHGRQPRGFAGIAARGSQRDGDHRLNSQARQGHCHRPCAHCHRGPRRRVAADHSRHRRGAAARSGAHAVRREPGQAWRRRTPHRRRRPDAAGGRRVVARARRRGHRHTAAASAPWPRVGGHRPPLCTAELAVQSGVRQPGQLARRCGQHSHRALRHVGRIDVPPRGSVVGHRATDPRIGGRCAGIREVPHACPRREGSPRTGARVVSGRGDRDAGGGPAQGADHGGGQPRAVDAGRPQARRGVADAGRDDLGRPVAQRNHPAPT